MFPRERRVRTRDDFSRLFREGKAWRGQLLTMRVALGSGPSRFGVVVGKRVDARATRRNRLKRQVRALARAEWPQVATGYLVVIYVQPAARLAETAALQHELQELLTKAKLL